MNQQYSNVIGNNNHNSGNIVKSYNNKFKGCTISISEDKRQVLEWLSPWTSRERHGTVRNERADGIGNWLLREERFSTWNTLENAKPVLLCHGDPGVGKTYISSLVIDTLSKGTYGEPVAITYVYCDFTAREVQSVRNLLGSVLRQVISAMAETPSEVLDAFEHARKYGDGCRLQLSEILTLLVGYLSNLKRNFICIDALDEFPQKERPELWMSLRRLTQECPGTRLFLTGRPHIEEEVRKYFPETLEMLQIDTRAGDVGLYLRARLDRDPELGAMNEELKADILKVIPEKISGIFLLVRINMDAILAEPTIHGRRQVLDRMTNGRGLEDAYSTTLERIRQQGGSKERMGMEALMWICHCERPLSPDELCHALGVELRTGDFIMDNVPQFQSVLGSTLGLVTVGEEDSTVRLLHLTLQEYLGEHPTLFPTAHSMMAEVCLTYLNSRFIRTLDVRPDTALIRAPFLKYATCSWGTHTSTKVTETLKLLALRLLSGYENHLSATILWREKIRKWDFERDLESINGLHCIAYWGIEEIAIAMLDMNRWDINAQDSEGCTPLSWASRYGGGGMVGRFAGQGDIGPGGVFQSGGAVLSFAAGLGNESIVELLLDRGDVNADLADNDGRTPLSHAAASGSEGVVKLLLERITVNPNLQDNDGHTPLSYAAQRGYLPLLNLLSNYGVPNRQSSGTIFQTKESLGGEKTPEKEGIHPLPLLHRTMSSPIQHISSYSSPPTLDLSRIGLLRNNLYRSHTPGHIIRTRPVPDSSPPLLCDPE